MGWACIHSVLRDRIEIFLPPNDPTPYDCQWLYHDDAPASKANEKILLGRAQRQYAVVILENDVHGAQKVYTHGAKLIVRNDTAMLYEMDGEFDVEGMPKYAIKLPFSPADTAAVEKWMSEVGLTTNMMTQFSKLTMRIAQRVGMFEMTQPKQTREDREHDTHRIRFYVDKHVDATVIYGDKDAILRESNTVGAQVAPPQLACLHRFGDIDLGGRAHCKRCGEFMSRAE